VAISAVEEANRVHVITLSGLLNWSEFQSFLAEAETRRVFAKGQIKILIQLEDFSGWEPSDAWGDVQGCSILESLVGQQPVEVEGIVV